MEHRIFYSWQSDLEKTSGQKKFILKAIEKAKTRLKNNFSLYIDQATRDTKGAINIAETIEQKIKQCDILIADTSIINSGSKFRLTPNPNVMFELGLAVEAKGWNKIILVLNDVFGSFEKLPFDIKTRRGIKFTLNKKNKTKNTTLDELANDFYSAISILLVSEPLTKEAEITNSLKNSTWDAFNHINGQTEMQERKGIVKIDHLKDNVFSFDFESYEHHQRFENGDWKAKFSLDKTALTADLVFRSGVDFGFKKIMFPIDENYDQLFLIGTPPAYGNQVLIRQKTQTDT